MKKKKPSSLQSPSSFTWISYLPFLTSSVHIPRLPDNKSSFCFNCSHWEICRVLGQALITILWFQSFLLCHLVTELWAFIDFLTIVARTATSCARFKTSLSRRTKSGCSSFRCILGWNRDPTEASGSSATGSQVHCFFPLCCCLLYQDEQVSQNLNFTPWKCLEIGYFTSFLFSSTMLKYFT